MEGKHACNLVKAAVDGGVLCALVTCLDKAILLIRAEAISKADGLV